MLYLYVWVRETGFGLGPGFDCVCMSVLYSPTHHTGFDCSTPSFASPLSKERRGCLKLTTVSHQISKGN